MPSHDFVFLFKDYYNLLILIALVLFQDLLNCTLQRNVSISHFQSIKNNSANFLVTKKIDKIAIKHEKTTIRALDTIGQSVFQPIYENLRNA